MKYVLSKINRGECVYCGMEFAEGDEVRETPDGDIHEDCFYDYMREYAKKNEWRVYTYSEIEPYLEDR